MFSSALMIPIRDAIETLQRLMRTDRLSQESSTDLAHVTDLCQQFRDAKSLILNGEISTEIDPDFTVHDSLEDVKEAAKLLRREMRSIVPIANATAEIYAVANQLQWELSEHDVDYAPRTNNYVAHSKEEVYAVLERIVREK